MLSYLLLNLLRAFHYLQVTSLYLVGLVATENSITPCWDGRTVWLSCGGNSVVLSANADTGASLGLVAAGLNNHGLCFDGTNIWVANAGVDSVTAIDIATRTPIGTYAVGNEPRGITFDGTDVWVCNYLGNTLTRISTGVTSPIGTILGTYPTNASPSFARYDGENLWVLCNGIVSKMTPSATNITPAAVGVQMITSNAPISTNMYANTTINNMTQGITFQTTGAVTTRLSVLSSNQQYFTGTITQTVVLPDVTTLAVGDSYKLVNLSTGAVTIQNTALVTLATLASLRYGYATCISVGAAPNWSFEPGGNPVVTL